MASIKVNPRENRVSQTIDIKVHCSFNDNELGKEYLLEINLEVLEGRMDVIQTIRIEEKLPGVKENEVLLEYSYPAAQHGFHLQFKWKTRLFEMVEMELEEVG